MKRYLRKIAALTTAAVMTVTPAITVWAETAEEGKVYNLPTIKTSLEGGTMVNQDITMQVLFSEEQLLKDNEVFGWTENKLNGIEVPENAVWKKVYMYRNKEASQDTDFWWEFNVEDSIQWKSTKNDIEEGRFNHLYDFSIKIGDNTFTGCRLYGGAMGDYVTENDFSGEHCMFVLVPEGYNGDITFTIYGSKLENGNRVKNEDTKLTYFISGHSKEEAEKLKETETEAEEEEEKEEVSYSLKKYKKGFRVVDSNGNPLKDAWYESPEGYFYYAGSDGYIYTNGITPDNYAVDDQGRWTVDDVPVKKEANGD